MATQRPQYNPLPPPSSSLSPPSDVANRRPSMTSQWTSFWTAFKSLERRSKEMASFAGLSLECSRLAGGALALVESIEDSSLVPASAGRQANQQFYRDLRQRLNNVAAVDEILRNESRLKRWGCDVDFFSNLRKVGMSQVPQRPRLTTEQETKALEQFDNDKIGFKCEEGTCDKEAFIKMIEEDIQVDKDDTAEGVLGWKSNLAVELGFPKLEEELKAAKAIAGASLRMNNCILEVLRQWLEDRETLKDEVPPCIRRYLADTILRQLRDEVELFDTLTTHPFTTADLEQFLGSFNAAKKRDFEWLDILRNAAIYLASNKALKVEKEIVEPALRKEADAKTLELALTWARDPSRRMCYRTDRLGALFVRTKAEDIKGLITDEKPR